jgi:hypothetical protein
MFPYPAPAAMSAAIHQASTKLIAEARYRK